MQSSQCIRLDLFTPLPMETVIRERQNEYYRALAEADERADVAPFVEFMLEALRDVMREAGDTDQVSDQVTDQVKMLLEAIGNSELSGSELMNALGFSHRPTFRANYLNPAMEGGWLDRTQPGSPRSPTQRYRLSEKARIWLQTRNEA